MHFPILLLLSFGFLLAPLAAEAATYTRTFRAEDVGKISYELGFDYGGMASDGCVYKVYSAIYENTEAGKKACQEAIRLTTDPEELKKIGISPSSVRVVENCNVLTKQTYTYTNYPAPLCEKRYTGVPALVLTSGGPTSSKKTSYVYDEFSQNEVGKFWIEATTVDPNLKCTTLDIDSFATKGECEAALPGQMERNKDWNFFGKCQEVTKNSYTYSVDPPMCAGSIQKYGLKSTDKSTPDGAGDQGTPDGAGDRATGLTNPLNNIDSLEDLLTAILGAIVRIGSIILVLALVYVGFLFVVAQGNEEKIRSAKSALLWTVIGGLILLGASAIGAVISATVGNL